MTLHVYCFCVLMFVLLSPQDFIPEVKFIHLLDQGLQLVIYLEHCEGNGFES